MATRQPRRRCHRLRADAPAAIRFGMKQPRAAGIVRRDSANDGHEHAKRLDEEGLMQELASGMQEPGMDDAAEAAGKEKQGTPSMRRRRRRRTLATAPRRDPAGTRGTTTPTRGEDLVGRSGARGTPTPTTTMPATSASSQPRRRLRRPPRHRCLLPTEAVAASSLLLLLLLLLPAFAFRHRGRPPPLPARAVPPQHVPPPPTLGPARRHGPLQAPPRGSRARRRGPQRSPATAAAARAPVLPVGGVAEGLPPLLPGVPCARAREREGKERER
uniref:Uncharacterized protein n=1 Tax=Oryza glumipatula TaxID=40148 RepID=A0A0E0A5Q4_9ORYZ